MSFWSRLLLLLRMRVRHELDGVEDPREALDLAYSRQLELQAKMRRAVADVVTARKRVELQGRQLEGSPDRLEEHARTELEQGRQDLAREALLRRAVIRGELGELQRQSSILAAEEGRLVAASKRLELQVQQFRIRREAVNAAYVAARASAEVNQLLAGLSQDDAELRLAVERAEHRIATIRARTAAVDGLLTREALGSGARTLGAPPSELDIPAADAEAAAELVRLEGDLLWGRESDPGSGRDS